MSLFKTKEFWSNQITTDEEFDQYSLMVSKIYKNCDIVLTGSHRGTLRVYKPTCNVSGDVGYKPNNLLVEKCFSYPILQVGDGKLVSGSQENQIAILHPRSIGVFNLVTNDGIAEHGTDHIFNLLYEHKLQKSAVNFTIGPFGGVQNRDFICTQSLDGMLEFFEQETFNFRCFLSEFFMPGPMVYVKSSDSFVTVSSNWCLQSYRYNILSDTRQNAEYENGSSSKIHSGWSYNLGEDVLTLQTIYQHDRRLNYISALGERSFYCFTDTGKLQFMKRLDFLPRCFHMYVLDDGKVMFLVISETNNLLVYQETTLKWSAQLQFAPVVACRGFFKEINGALVMLSEDGYLCFSYLETEPFLFYAPPIKNQEMNFKDVQVELESLNKITRPTVNDGVKFENCVAERELAININVWNNLDNYKCIPEKSLKKRCKVNIEIVPHAIFEEVHLSVFVQKPLVVVPQTEFYSILCDLTKFDCFVFTENENDIPSLDMEVIVSFMSSMGVPKICYKKTNLSLCLVMETCAPTKENDHKITININENPVHLANLFTEFMGENSLTVNSNAVGFKRVTVDGPIVTILLGKNSRRYRLQSNNFLSLNIFFHEVVRRLKRLMDSANLEVTTDFLSLHEIVPYIKEHFDTRQHMSILQDDLSQLLAQLRLIQKRLITKFKQKNPTSLTNVNVLLQDTNEVILKTSERLQAKNSNLQKSQINLSRAMHLIISLSKLIHTSESLLIIESALSPHIYDLDYQNWEDVLNVSLCFLLSTSLAKSEKDKLRAPHASFDKVKDVIILEKHFGRILERIVNKGKLI